MIRGIQHNSYLGLLLDHEEIAVLEILQLLGLPIIEGLHRSTLVQYLVLNLDNDILGLGELLIVDGLLSGHLVLKAKDLLLQSLTPVQFLSVDVSLEILPLLLQKFDPHVVGRVYHGHVSPNSLTLSGVALLLRLGPHCRFVR